MKTKVYVMSLLVVIMLCTASCRHKSTYDFVNPTDDIVAVAIVDLSFDLDDFLVETEVKQVDDIDGFLKAFCALDCYTWFGDPIPVTQEGVEDTAIKITYANGEYELINWNGQSEYRTERGLKYYAGYRVFDEQQFEALIKNFLAD